MCAALQRGWLDGTTFGRFGWTGLAARALLARVAEVGKVMESADRSGRAASDLTKFTASRATVELFIKGGGTTNGTAYLPAF